VRRTVLLFIAMGMISIMPIGVALAASPVRIIGLRCDALGDDTKNLNGEYVVLQNTSRKSVVLAGWSIHDKGRTHLYTFPAGYKLGPDAVVRVHTGEGRQRPGDLYWGQGSSVWNNPPEGDTATLRACANRLATFRT
jgi:competence protein ComEC